MRRTLLGLAGAALLAAAVSLPACRERDARPGPPTSPDGAAVALFDLAAEGLSSLERLGEVVDVDDAGAARCADAVASMASASSPRVVSRQPLPDPGAEALDVEAALRGGGVARFEIQVARRSDGTWRVTAFSGPGVSWPPRRTPVGEGLSSSSPPR